jgi:hypothetical protein
MSLVRSLEKSGERRALPLPERASNLLTNDSINTVGLGGNTSGASTARTTQFVAPPTNSRSKGLEREPDFARRISPTTAPLVPAPIAPAAPALIDKPTLTAQPSGKGGLAASVIGFLLQANETDPAPNGSTRFVNRQADARYQDTASGFPRTQISLFQLAA